MSGSTKCLLSTRSKKVRLFIRRTAWKGIPSSKEACWLPNTSRTGVEGSTNTKGLDELDNTLGFQVRSQRQSYFVQAEHRCSRHPSLRTRGLVKYEMCRIRLTDLGKKLNLVRRAFPVSNGSLLHRRRLRRLDGTNGGAASLDWIRSMSP